MRQVKLQFPVAEDVWNFLAATRKIHVDAEDNIAEGWFTAEELELACQRFGAEEQPYTPRVAPRAETIAAKTTPVTTATTDTDEGQTVELYGKSGRVYPGKIYSKATHSVTPTAHALICLANSSYSNNSWQHTVNAIYATENVEQERERFSQRDDVSHLIVLPTQEESGFDATDDLIRSYLHG